MNPDRLHARGAPLQALALVSIGWVGLRLLTWSSPFPLPLLPHLVRPSAALAMAAAPDRGDLPQTGRARAGQTAMNRRVADRSPGVAYRPALLPVRAAASRIPAFSTQRDLSEPYRTIPASGQAPSASAERREAAPFPVAPFTSRETTSRETPKRWSLDAWVLARPASRSGTGPGSPGLLPASYGASQAGALLRYRLSPGQGVDPALYARVAHPLVASASTELAAGLSAWPVRALPLRLHAELRARQVTGRTDWAPAVFATSELAPISLPGGVLVEAYGQAGYVGGDYPTAFADGQVRADRRLAAIGPVALHAGAGAWAGAQRGASRVDIGPSMAARFAIGPAPVRLTVDYRVRVAGNAAPDTGVAVTLATGF